MDLANLIDPSDLRQRSSDIKRIFFYRVCGTGMGAAACLLKEHGYEIEGGDNNFFPPMSTYLESTGIPCHKLSDVSNEDLSTFDLIVVGNVVPRDGVDAKRIEKLGVPFVSFPTAIGSLILSKNNVVGIAGTHGKTTTTYFFVQVFEKLGFIPGYLIGGVMDGRPSSRLGDGSYFFIESDEYDSAYFEKISKFRNYHIKHLVLTSLEFDHGDIFDSIEDIIDQFRQMLKTDKPKVIYSSDFEANLVLKKEFSKKLSLQDYGENSATGPFSISSNEKGTSFSLKVGGKIEEFSTNLIGLHNILNITTVILFAISEKIDLKSIRSSIADLQLVKRRQEERGHYHGTLVVDDFAHHPRAVALTISAMKEKYPQKKVVVVMEPNSATARSDIFQAEFGESLSLADKVIYTKPTKSTTVKHASDIDCDAIVETIKSSGKEAVVVEALDQLRSQIDRTIGEDYLLLVLSNGTCLGLWESKFVDQLV